MKKWEPKPFHFVSRQAAERNLERVVEEADFPSTQFFCFDFETILLADGTMLPVLAVLQCPDGRVHHFWRSRNGADASDKLLAFVLRLPYDRHIRRVFISHNGKPRARARILTRHTYDFFQAPDSTIISF